MQSSKKDNRYLVIDEIELTPTPEYLTYVSHNSSSATLSNGLVVQSTEGNLLVIDVHGTPYYHEACFSHFNFTRHVSYMRHKKLTDRHYVDNNDPKYIYLIENGSPVHRCRRDMLFNKGYIVSDGVEFYARYAIYNNNLYIYDRLLEGDFSLYGSPLLSLPYFYWLQSVVVCKDSVSPCRSQNLEFKLRLTDGNNALLCDWVDDHLLVDGRRLLTSQYEELRSKCRELAR